MPLIRLNTCTHVVRRVLQTQSIPNHHSNKELKNCAAYVTEILIKDHSKTTQKFWGSSLFQNVEYPHTNPNGVMSCTTNILIVMSVTTSNLAKWKLLTANYHHLIWVQIWPHFSSLLLHMYLCCVTSSSPYFILSLYCFFLYSHAVISCIFASVSFASIPFFFCKCWPICDSMSWHHFVTNKFQEVDKGPSIKFIRKK